MNPETNRTCNCKRPTVVNEEGVPRCIDCGYSLKLERPRRAGKSNGGKVDELAALVAEKVVVQLPRPQDSEPWIGVKGAAKHLTCKPQRIYDLTSRADETGIPFAKEGTRLLFRRSELDAWVRNGR